MRAIQIAGMCAALIFVQEMPALAQSESAADLPKPIEQCIRDNAPAVEQAFPSLNEGVNFLVTDLCGAPIAADQERLRRERAAATQEQAHAQCEANRQTKGPDGQQATGVKQADPCATTNPLSNLLNPFLGPLQDTMNAQLRYFNAKPPAPTSYAARLLLDLRMARLKTTNPQGAH